MTVEYLALEDLLQLAADLGPLVVRDLGLLDAAVQRPQTTLYGQEAYSGLHEKAAVLLESLSRNHALADGNKRLGWLATFVFYELNDIQLDAPDDAAYELVIGVSTGEVDYSEASRRLARWATSRRS
ncbi:MAG: type II toxin-antitoxin system death-on-curing family toxin [Pseudolysinimonas sp.]